MATEDINFDFDKAKNEIMTNGYAYLYSASNEAEVQKINYPIHLLKFGKNCGRYLIETIGEVAVNKRIVQINKMGEKLIPSFDKQKIPNELWHPMLVASIALLEQTQKQGIPHEQINEINKRLIQIAIKFFEEAESKALEIHENQEREKTKNNRTEVKSLSRVSTDVKIVVIGTKRSAVLDNGERYVIEFKKNEPLRDGLHSVQDLVENAIDTSFTNGDMISSLVVGGNDLVREAIVAELENSNMDTEEAYVNVCNFPYMSNADPSDVFDLVSEVRSSLKAN
jgi:hypothetical protein